MAPVNDEAKKHNQNLPGMGGIYNTVNMHLYHYAGNNPIRYTDPTGMWVDNEDGTYTAEKDDTLWGLAQEIFGDGSRWEEFGYEGDPTKLQVGDTVGRKRNDTTTEYDLNQSGIIDFSNVGQEQTPWKSWWNKSDGEPLTAEEASIQSKIGIGEMIVGPIGGTALTTLDPAAFLAGIYVMADGALVFSSAQDKIKKSPFVSIPTTFLMPFAQTEDKQITLPAGGRFIW